jgi:hypothetical protein
MKFLMTYESLPDAPPPTPEQLAALGKFTEEMMKSGKVVLTGGIVRATTGIRAKNENGKISFTDGPFAESKELIDGFAIVDVASKEEAFELSRQFMQVAGEGKGEILRIYDEGPPPEALNTSCD